MLHGSDSKESACKVGRPGFSPWVGKIPWRRKWQPTPILLSGKPHGWRSLVGYSPWSCKKSDTIEQLYFTYTYDFKFASPTQTLSLSPRSWSSSLYDISTRIAHTLNIVKNELFIPPFFLHLYLSAPLHSVSVLCPIIHQVILTRHWVVTFSFHWPVADLQY